MTAGRVNFPNTSLADSTTSHAGIAPITKGSFVLKFGVDVFNVTVNPKQHMLYQIDDGTNPNCKMSVWNSSPAAGTWQCNFAIPGLGHFLTAAFTQSQTLNPLPAFGAGNDVILYIWWDNPALSHGISLFDSLGNLIATLVDTTNRVNLPVYTNGGRIRFNFSQNAVNTTGNPNLEIDGFAVYNQQRPAGFEWTTPSASDTGIVAYYRFDEGTGTTSADDLAGPSLTLTGTSWVAGGTWAPSGTIVVIPNAPVTSATAVGSVSVVTGTPFVVVIPNAPLTSQALVPTSGSVNHTIYVPSLSSATAVGAITFQISSSSAAFVPVTGVSSRAMVGGFRIHISNPVPPINPTTLQYILDMAVASSTANTGPDAPAVIANTAQIIERIRADQRAIFTKVAERNRSFFLASAALRSTDDSQGRIFDLSTVTPPVERPVQLTLADSRVVSIVDQLDLAGELAPRCYVNGTQLIEVGSDYSPVAGSVSATLLYVQAPIELDPLGDLTQFTTIPSDWSDLLILPLAQFIALSDVTPAPIGGSPPRADEIAWLQQTFDDTLESFMTYIDHYGGTPAFRFDIPRPWSGPR